jgi:hypothetical protein
MCIGGNQTRVSYSRLLFGNFFSTAYDVERKLSIVLDDSDEWCLRNVWWEVVMAYFKVVSQKFDRNTEVSISVEAPTILTIFVMVLLSSPRWIPVYYFEVGHDRISLHPFLFDIH